MIVPTGKTFTEVTHQLRLKMVGADPVRTERWQGVAANQDTFELRNATFEVPLMGMEDLDHWRHDIKPNVDWCDPVFSERVGGEPLNPGEAWKAWPDAASANSFRDKNGRFNHTYQERLWPKFPRRGNDGRLAHSSSETGKRRYPTVDVRPKMGIDRRYGDLGDWIDYLAREPHNRQHCQLVFFPEDTGYFADAKDQRRPCSMFYQLMVRDNRLHMVYTMRSVDFRRHFADDCYLAVRLMLWALDQCREIRPEFWAAVKPGTYAMWMTSLHIFASDKKDLVEGKW